MIKKFLGILLAVTMLAGIYPVALAEYTDISADSGMYEAVSLLSDMKIVSGYTDGSFKPQKTLSRAEFAKLIVMIYNKQSEAQYNSVISGFKDVPQGAWYVGYVNYISQKKIINGYSDGTFGPDRAITYAEAVTILCRILGYDESVVGYYWPNNYLAQADKMGLSEGFLFGQNDPITRGAAAVLIDRILFTDVTASQSGKMKLIEFLGYSLLEDNYVVATRAENQALTSKQIKTASGVYSVAEGVTVPKIGTAGTFVINKDGEIAGMKKEAMEKLTVYVTNIPEANTVEYRTENGEKGKFRFDPAFTTYVNYNKGSFAQSGSSIGIDTEITFYGKINGEWEFALIDNEESGTIPVLATRNYSDTDNYIGDMPINKANLEIYRNGEAAKLSDIVKNDVIYYNTKTNVIDVYSNKVSGIYTEAYPDKAYVTSVKVAGKTYELSNSGAAKKSLDATPGSFSIGERVTLLLGKNDKVEFAVELTDFNYFDYGVLLDCKVGVSTDSYDEGVSRMTADIFMPDGETYTYTVDKDYSDYLKGELVKLTYVGDKVTLSKADSVVVTGALDISNRKFAGMNVLRDVKVIGRLSKEDADVVSVEALDFDTLGVKELTAKNVLGVIKTNSFGDIGIMYLENLSGSFEYGYLVGGEAVGKGEISSYQYKIFSDGITKTYSDSVRYTITPKAPAYFKSNGSSITEIYSMKKIESATDYDAIEGGRIKINNKVYNLADEIQIVYVEDSLMGKFKTVSISELEKMNIDSIEVYSVKDEGAESVIKMIVVS